MKNIDDDKPKCLICNRKLIKWRANSYKDWNKRPLHKTCWIKLQNGEATYYKSSPQFYKQSLPTYHSLG